MSEIWSYCSLEPPVTRRCNWLELCLTFQEMGCAEVTGNKSTSGITFKTKTNNNVLLVCIHDQPCSRTLTTTATIWRGITVSMIASFIKQAFIQSHSRDFTRSGLKTEPGVLEPDGQRQGSCHWLSPVQIIKGLSVYSESASPDVDQQMVLIIIVRAVIKPVTTASIYWALNLRQILC